MSRCLRFVATGWVLLALLLPLRAEARPVHLLRIWKAERKLELVVGGEVVRTFRVGLGGAPVGDKEVQGDLRTPEGEFYVAWRNPNSSFHRFLGLSYPMPRHADRGYAEGRITQAEREAIVKSVSSRGRPPQYTALGGLVGIHGGGSSVDWTLGCIAVSDSEIEWLYSQIKEGDPIVVLP